MMESLPLSIPDLYKRFNRSDNDIMEGLEDKNSIGFGAIFIQLLFFGISMYASYINLKCNCGEYIKFSLFALLLCCCPLCTVPYLYYQKFVNNCV